MSEMENPSQILVSLGRGRHAAGSVGCWCWKRGLYSTGGDFRGT